MDRCVSGLPRVTTKEKQKLLNEKRQLLQLERDGEISEDVLGALGKLGYQSKAA